MEVRRCEVSYVEPVLDLLPPVAVAGGTSRRRFSIVVTDTGRQGKKPEVK